MNAIEVEIKVVGFFGDESVAVGKKVGLEGGATVDDALVALSDAGALSDAACARARELQPPLYLTVNHQRVDGSATEVTLQDGDVVSVTQLMAGG